MKATTLWGAALLCLPLAASAANAQVYVSPVFHRPFPCAADFRNTPGFYVASPGGMIYGPNYCLVHHGPPFQGCLPGQLGQHIMAGWYGLPWWCVPPGWCPPQCCCNSPVPLRCPEPSGIRLQIGPYVGPGQGYLPSPYPGYGPAYGWGNVVPPAGPPMGQGPPAPPYGPGSPPERGKGGQEHQPLPPFAMPYPPRSGPGEPLPEQVPGFGPRPGSPNYPFPAYTQDRNRLPYPGYYPQLPYPGCRPQLPRLPEPAVPPQHPPPPTYVNHPCARSPRDFFMWTEVYEDMIARQRRPALVP